MNENITYLQLIMETIVTFFVLLILTRFLGKKQLSHLTFFNYITGITIGSLAANMIMLSSKDYLKELSSLVIWCLLTMIIAYIGLKSGRARVILDGQPTILVKKGVIDKGALSKTRLNIDDLTMMIRQKDVFSITEVDYAILEPNGTLSILKKPEYQNPQKRDLKIEIILPTYIPTEIIVDGKIIENNLVELGLSREWLDKQLEKAGLFSIQNVLYAEIQSDGQLFIQQA
ncbi:YetF domain-containing protein [Lysinibacillus antri]|uniref:DUF421 domain-containing protein n=1 Tax=Lysinibacillus antri TaxID=2498145 RepID=A0A3S0R7X7_9BACI|nr:DUF421 domain-containing protein [Lysinibacillus antri]RUL55607.1 DUF421 domain-containing protein [Lysinibacillus antri]